VYLWTQYPQFFYVMTSNIQGFYWNPALGANGPLFVTLSPTTATTSSAAGAPSFDLTTAAAAVVIIVIVAIAAIVLRSRGKKTKT